MFDSDPTKNIDAKKLKFAQFQTTNVSLPFQKSKITEFSVKDCVDSEHCMQFTINKGAKIAKKGRH